MLWIFLFFVLILMGLYYLQIRRKNGLLLMAAVSDDSDMKIVPPSGVVAVPEDDGEQAAREFVAQKENGNIDKAYDLGNRIADAFFEKDGVVFASCTKSLQPVVLLQRKILFAFTVDMVLGRELSSVLAETVSQRFSFRVQQADADLYDQVNDPETLSCYLLCMKKGMPQIKEIGKAFAHLCDEEGSESLCALGECLYQNYADACRKMIENTQFCQ